MAGLQTITLPVTGTAISSTTFGVPVKNNCDALANPPIAKMRNSANQSITNGTDTAMTWDTEDFDTVGGHSTVTNTSRYTCQAGYAGYYQVNGTVFYAASTLGSFRTAWFKVNGTDVTGSSNKSLVAANTTMSVSTGTKVFLNAGDFVELWTRQDTSGALAAIGTAARETSWFEVEWVHQ